VLVPVPVLPQRVRESDRIGEWEEALIVVLEEAKRVAGTARMVQRLTRLRKAVGMV
jgi:hypothetical protein